MKLKIFVFSLILINTSISISKNNIIFEQILNNRDLIDNYRNNKIVFSDFYIGLLQYDWFRNPKVEFIKKNFYENNNKFNYFELDEKIIIDTNNFIALNLVNYKSNKIVSNQISFINFCTNKTDWKLYDFIGIEEISFNKLNIERPISIINELLKSPMSISNYLTDHFNFCEIINEKYNAQKRKEYFTKLSKDYISNFIGNYSYELLGFWIYINKKNKEFNELQIAIKNSNGSELYFCFYSNDYINWKFSALHVEGESSAQ